MSQSIESMIEVLRAHEAGWPVESKLPNHDRWTAIPEPNWNFKDNLYRVKPDPPEPREWWVVDAAKPTVYYSEKDAKNFANYNSSLPVVHVREVMEAQ